MIDNLKKDLTKDYEPLLENLKKSKFKGDSCVFCAQWGNKIFKNVDETKIFVIGRAVNGWINDIKDVNIIFGDTDERLFNRDNQVKWVEDSWKNKNGYTTSSSAFWRVVKNVINSINSNCNFTWYENIAWSNLFKIAPNAKGGNPSKSLIDLQRSYCISIFKKELRYFNPDIVLMFTGGWEGYFLKELMGLPKNANLPIPLKRLYWGSKYSTKLFEVELEGLKKKFIVSEHPMGKKEAPHVEAILELINEF